MGDRHDLFARIRDLQARSTELERRIAARSADLEATNRRLAREIEERELLETRLWDAIREKDLILKEIHHRVKNNLQVVSSLLNLSASRTSDPAAVRILTDARSKVQTMAMVHSGLFKSDRLSAIEIEAQLKDLFHYLAPLYGHSEDVRLQLTSEGTRLPLSLAMPCALMANELMSNSLKHAFRGRAGGWITAGFRRRLGWLEMHYGDDGCGLPEGIDLDAADTLGLKLIRIMATVQLKGELERLPAPGCGFRFRFPMEGGDADSGRHPAG